MSSGLYGGGVSETAQEDINVTQYGWTTEDVKGITLILDYVKLVQDIYDKIKLVEGNIEDIIVELDQVRNIYNEVRTMYADFLAKYPKLQETLDLVDQKIVIINAAVTQVNSDKQVVSNLRDDVLQMRNTVTTLVSTAQNILADVTAKSQQVTTDTATTRANRTEVERLYAECLKLTNELRAGQVYRGTWNPNTQAWPAHLGTNSVWDVVLNAGQSEYTWNSIKWLWGDRLLYVLASTSYEQVESGVGVLSVNGKAGFVTLIPSDIGAVNKTGDTMTGQLTSTATFATSAGTAQIFHDGRGTANTQINLRSMREAAAATWLWEKVAGGSLYYSTGTTGAGTNKVRLDVAAGEMYLGATGVSRVYHQGFKPTAADVAALALTGGTVTGKTTAYVTGFGVWPNTNVSDANNYIARSPLVVKVNNNAIHFFGDDTLNARRMGIQSSHSDTAFSTTYGILDLNPYGGAVRVNGGTVYHTLNKPTAVDVDAIPLAGGVATGNVSAPAFIQTAAQDSSAGACTRKDYVDGLIGTVVPKTTTVNGKPLSGNISITAADVGAKPSSYVPDTIIQTAKANANAPLYEGFVSTSNSAGATNYPSATVGVGFEVTKGVPAGTDTEGCTFQLWSPADSSLVYLRTGDGSAGGWVYRPWETLYTSVNKPTAADIGALAVGGTAASATKLATARTIAGVSFDGTANISLTAANVGALASGGTAVAATKLATPRLIGGVSFDGTADITLPGVNAAGTQSTSGNAATATKLATARTIAGVAFDGTANISLTAAGVGAIPTTGGTYTGQLRGTATGGSFATVYTRNDAPLTSTSNHSGSSFAPALNIRYSHQAGWSGSYYIGDLCETAATAGQLAIGHINSAAGENWNILITGANGFTSFPQNVSANDVQIRSDERLKSNFEPIEGALGKVVSLSGMTYNKVGIEGREAGLIAQSVKEVLPEAIGKTTVGGLDGEFLTISNSAVTALLVEAIKELKAEVDTLRAELKEVRNAST